ncbi:Ferrienterobactin receptor precursor [Mariniflexile rhizosphaerae]|uniref:SusC/RagA family TonB-linked outer membrane protein n=1 Tax=unclassified Mariniflexile TaxID=2643887 RepID=UPI000CB4A2B5|nr:SusC/RagA family TonB-linked outer membrane protein [Mariniflexile sp. TRM1-10]AXP81468.1 Ferrienterobactin receptor precursor [Mariniflexile sp. TRM1-10]PLB18320.1 MAG: SusC, outer membrane protein involved in starch binding [Flavobacteriaceae bacterium FS1-H7996/R]
MIQNVLKLLFVFCISLFQYANAQTTVTGTITDASSGIPLPGASIVVKGTTNGVSSDFDGNYSIEVSANASTLVVSYVGYSTKEVELTGATTINITLSEDTETLGEVVVTALGIKREKKSLTYSAQTVSTESLTEARSLNIANSLSGKVAGLNFSTTSSGVGSSSRITLRGNRSLTGNNQPLYVIDGVPIDNSVSSPSTDIGGFTSFDGISNINPEDIASITVLKGPSAAALYGSRASNGVIVITTKKGSATDKARITVSSNFMGSSAYNLLNLQNEYGQGNEGTYDALSKSSWGPRMEGQSVAAWQLEHNPDYAGPATYAFNPQPNNGMDFFQSGYTWSRSLTASMGSEKTQGYFSYTNTEAEGIVVGNELDRHNVNLRLTSDLTNKLHLDVKTNFISQKIDNAIGAGEGQIGEAVYTMPRNLPYSQYKDFEYIDDTGQIQYNYINANTLSTLGNNPFWLAKRNLRTDERNRIITFASLTYDFTDELSLMVRAGLDQATNKQNISRYAATAILNQDFGSYSEFLGENTELNTDFLLSYDKDLGDLKLNVMAGGNAMEQKSTTLSSGGTLTKRNYFSLNNLASTTVTPGYSNKKIHSLYGSAQVAFKEYLFLDVTARNDWSSTLPASDRSFFYPSVGLTGILTDMFDMKSDALSFLKVRGSYAQVGNDTRPYLLAPGLAFYGFNGGVVQASTLLNNPNLKPEISSSTEFGFDARFLNNKIGLDFTWFKTNTTDQIFTINVPESSGYSNQVVNGGEIENKGIEAVLNANIVDTENFSWDATVNFATYKTKVLSILGDREELNLSTGFERLAQAIVKKGGDYGDLYIRGFNRTDDGEIIVNATSGLPEFTSGFDVLAGNFNPDWTAGLYNQFRYKDFTLSFLVDFRIGGEVVSYSQARMAGAGVSDITLSGRDGFVVDGVVDNGDGTYSPNTTSITAENYWSQVASRDPRSAEDFVFDATNVRLRELVLGYSLPSKALTKTPFSGVHLSIVGRNLFFFANKAEHFDPEQGVSVGNLQGIESYNIPSTRDFGFNVKLNF